MNHSTTIKLLTQKLDFMKLSSKALEKYSQLLTQDNDDILVYFEFDIDKDITSNKIENEYTINKLDQLLPNYKRITKETVNLHSLSNSSETTIQLDNSKRRHSLNILVKNSIEVDIILPLQYSCQSIVKGSGKSIIYKMIKINNLYLGLYGLGLSPKDQHFNYQVCCLIKLVKTHMEKYCPKDMSFIPIIFGDINSRIVAGKDILDIEESVIVEDSGTHYHINNQISSKQEIKLTNKSINNLCHLLTSNQGRKTLLDYNSLTYQGIIYNGSNYSPCESRQNLSTHFNMVTEWLKTTTEQDIPEPTYSKYPSHSEFIMTQEEIETILAIPIKPKPNMNYRQNIIRNENLNKELLIEYYKKKYFKWGIISTIPKSKDQQQNIIKVTDSTSYLNEDEAGNKIFLQLGWLDSYGIGNYKLSKNSKGYFLSYNTIDSIYAFDHELTSCRIKISHL